MEKQWFLGVDIGGTKIAAGLVTPSGKIVARYKTPTPQKSTAKQIYKAIYSLIEEALKQARNEGARVQGIGVGVPGIVKPDQKEILITPNTNLSGFPLGKRLEKDFAVNVTLGNDVNLGLLGEQWLGVARNKQNVIGLFPGTGVGGAIIINGTLVLGSQGAAGELGHMIMDYNSDKASAGIYGSLEALASRRAIEREIRIAVSQKKNSCIRELAGKRLQVIKSSVIAEALQRKDPDVLRIFDEVILVLGRACISLRHIFNPDIIVLGGGLVEACGSYILPRVNRISESDPFFSGIDHCRIVQSRLGDTAVILGAVALIRQRDEVNTPDGDKMRPAVEYSRDKGLFVGDRHYGSNVFIRADGKIKKLKKLDLTAGGRPSPSLDEAALRKVCKKTPQSIVIGYLTRKIIIKPDAKSFLKAKALSLIQLPLSEAVRTFQAAPQGRALICIQAPAEE